jgi:secreted trypsin-like serine protease
VAAVKLFGRSSFEPIRINQDSLIPESRNDSMHVIGWGSTNSDDANERSSVQETVVFYIPNDECQQVVGSFNGYEKSFSGAIIDVMLCALNFEELSDSCKGDSGGKLLMHGYNSSQEDF